MATSSFNLKDFVRLKTRKSDYRLSLSLKRIYVSKAIIESLGNPELIYFGLNQIRGILAIGKANEKEECTVKPRLNGKDKFYFFQNSELLEQLSSEIGVDFNKYNIKFRGQYIEDVNLVVFDITKYECVEKKQ